MLSDEKLKNVIKELELWIKQYVNESGAKGIVIGNSGGKDREGHNREKERKWNADRFSFIISTGLWPEQSRSHEGL